MTQTNIEEDGKILPNEIKQQLSWRGILRRYHSRNITEYPDIKKWFLSDEGKDFFSGKKELVLFGGNNAIDIGILIQRWFIVSYDEGYATSLIELNDDLTFGEQKEEDKQFLSDPRLHKKSIFIKNFQDDIECPLDSKGIYRVANHIRLRHASPMFDRMIFQISDKSLKWWPHDIRDFILNKCLWIYCDSRN